MSRRAPSRHRRQTRRSRRRFTQPAGAALVACGVLAVGLAAGGWALAGRPDTSVLAGRIKHVPAPHGKIAPVPRPSAQVRVGKPVRLVIPAIGVRTRLIHLGLTSEHTMVVPATTSVAGWFTGSPRPGAIGSSIIAGHIDSRAGPGVFYRLREMRPGERAYVIRANKSIAVFKVIKVRMYPKDHFPTGKVYGPVPDAELRIITCGGLFDYATGSYLSNVVVYAVLVK